MLHAMFDEVTKRVPKNYELWRLYGRLCAMLGEEKQTVVEMKLKECRSLMVPSWEDLIDNCEKLERGIKELIAIVGAEVQIELEMKYFVSTTLLAVERCLQRKTTVVVSENFVI